MISIRKDSCKGCKLCISFCPKGVLIISKKINSRGVRYPTYEDDSNCSRCGICYLMCPDVAIEII